MFWFFGPEACGILAPQPRIEPAPPALEGEVLTTGPPGKSRVKNFKPSSLCISAMALEPAHEMSQAKAWDLGWGGLASGSEHGTEIKSLGPNQKRHEARVRIWDEGTAAKHGEVPGEQLQVLYFPSCVLSHQWGRNGQLERMLSRPVGEVRVASRP